MSTYVIKTVLKFKSTVHLRSKHAKIHAVKMPGFRKLLKKPWAFRARWLVGTPLFMRKPSACPNIKVEA